MDKFPVMVAASLSVNEQSSLKSSLEEGLEDQVSFEVIEAESSVSNHRPDSLIERADKLLTISSFESSQRASEDSPIILEDEDRSCACNCEII